MLEHLDLPQIGYNLLRLCAPSSCTRRSPPDLPG